MSTGKVKFFNETKGFGFIIEDETDKEFFVHITEVNGDLLNEDDRVEFEVVESDKGLNAVNVTVIND
jgi:CspA family cold shock protein